MDIVDMQFGMRCDVRLYHDAAGTLQIDIISPRRVAGQTLLQIGDEASNEEHVEFWGRPGVRTVGVQQTGFTFRGTWLCEKRCRPVVR